MMAIPSSNLGPATTLYSHLHRASTERTFFEAQMRNTQNEVVIPLEVAIRTDRWKPSFTFVQDITLSDTLPDEAWHQENVRLCSPVLVGLIMA